MIELLSPYNKAANTKGREAFVRKRNLVFASTSHWIEIDLLRASERPPEVAGKSDYYVLLKRAKQSRLYEGWFIDIRDKLPIIAVPWRPPFGDAPLDLQAAFEDTYARAHYAAALASRRRALGCRAGGRVACRTRRKIRLEHYAASSYS